MNYKYHRDEIFRAAILDKLKSSNLKDKISKRVLSKLSKNQCHSIFEPPKNHKFWLEKFKVIFIAMIKISKE